MLEQGEERLPAIPPSAVLATDEEVPQIQRGLGDIDQRITDAAPSARKKNALYPAPRNSAMRRRSWGTVMGLSAFSSSISNRLSLASSGMSACVQACMLTIAVSLHPKG